MTFVHESTAEAVQRWLNGGADVVVQSDTGGGRTTVLRAIAERFRQGGTSTVLLGGSPVTASLPLGLFAFHPAFELQQVPRPSVSAIHRVLAEELSGRRSILIVDDIDHVDPASLAVIDATITRPDVRLVCSLPLAHRESPAIGHMLRRASRVVTTPLGLSAMTTVLTDHLRGDIDAGLVWAVTARSAGNPRVAVALTRAATFSGAIRQINGVWTETGMIDESPGAPVLDALLSPLDSEYRLALELIAWFGLLDVDKAVRLVDPAILARLVEIGRLAAHDLRGVPTVAVSPPALARALRRTVPPLRRSALRLQAQDVLGVNVPDPEDAESESMSSEAVRGLMGLDESSAPRFLSDSVAVLQESLRAQAALAVDRWEHHHGVAQAIQIVRMKLLNDAPDVDIDAVFGAIEASPDDDPEDIVNLVFLRAQWSAINGFGFQAGYANDPSAGGTLTIPPFDPTALRAVEAFFAGKPVVEFMREWPKDDPKASRAASHIGHIFRASALVEAGTPDEALNYLGGWDRSGQRADFSDRLDAIRGDALILVGQFADALTWSRARLSDAYERLDAFAIRLAARGLATAAFASDDPALAWWTVSSALRLGRFGAIHRPYDERILAIGAVLRARARDLTMAHGLLRELEAQPRAYVPGLDFMRPWATAEVAIADDPENGAATDRLWAAGAGLVDQGHVTAGLACWAFTPRQLNDAQLDALESVVAEVQVPVFGPLVEIHRSLVRGDSTAILSALKRGPRQGPMARVAFQVAQVRAASEGRAELTPESLLEAGEERLSAMLAAIERPTADQGGLSVREIEVAALAKEGMTNREIASRLYLSVRTIENHMFRIMRKLGLENRSQLVSWIPPVR